VTLELFALVQQQVIVPALLVNQKRTFAGDERPMAAAHASQSMPNGGCD
jgi:hypothetical protein